MTEFKFGVHFDRVEGTDLDAYLATHADREVNVENAGLVLKLAQVIGLLGLVLDDVDAPGRALDLADQAGDTPQALGWVFPVVHEEREHPGVFRGGNLFFRILDGRQTISLDVTPDEISGRRRQTVDQAAAEHAARLAEFRAKSSGEGTAHCAAPVTKATTAVESGALMLAIEEERLSRSQDGARPRA
jgi:hypothetical protein